jgi:NAD(P)H-dependent FMN reductase
MVKLGVVIGSTRPNRKAEGVARWVIEAAGQRPDAQLELIDIAAFDLPLLDEPRPPSLGQYEKPHTKKWAGTIQGYDGFVFVTPEYNHGTSGALKNAIDFIYREWNNKAAGFVSYGSAGGARAVEHLRLVMAEIQIADVRAQVMLSLATDFEKYTTFAPGPQHAKTLNTLFSQVESWSKAMKTLRSPAP